MLESAFILAIDQEQKALSYLTCSPVRHSFPCMSSSMNILFLFTILLTTLNLPLHLYHYPLAHTMNQLITHHHHHLCFLPLLLFLLALQPPNPPIHPLPVRYSTRPRRTPLYLQDYHLNLVSTDVDHFSLEHGLASRYPLSHVLSFIL